MKTDYISPGAAAMSRLRRTTASARQIQREQLQAILRQNAAAEYGARYGFSHIRSLADFLIRCKSDGNLSVGNSLSFQLFRHRHDLRNPRLVVRTENRRAVACNQRTSFQPG